ncbi:MAG: BA14K family protein [Pseudolabrys sp.]|nr:BA14K family protein [Pseudolabrys sp.]
MRITKSAALAALTLAAVSALAVSPADARWRHHHGHRGGGAAIGGFVAGALLGGALAAQQPYYYRRGYAPYRGDAVQYCLSRFKSYDPYSGTYLGYDGYRHPCP